MDSKETALLKAENWIKHYIFSRKEKIAKIAISKTRP